jgi:hypothetical protein
VATQETQLTRIVRLRRSLTRAEARAQKVRDELHEAIIDAHQAGESPTLIAQVSGYTVQRVHQIVAARRKGAR